MKISWLVSRFFELLVTGNVAEATRKSRVFFHRLRFHSAVRRWRPAKTTSEITTNGKPEVNEVGVFIHLHYPEYLEQALTALSLYSSLYPNVKFHFSVSSQDLYEKLTKLSASFQNVNKIVCVSNRGRNFGPLLTNFRDELASFQFVIHLHSKKSPHTDSDFAQKWSSMFWGSLLLEPGILMGFLNRMRSDAAVKLAYPIDLDLFPPDSYHWATCRPFVPKEFSDTLRENEAGSGRILFPIGGMFICRSEVFGDWLFLKEWGLSDFPEELGQVDGTVHHAIERLVGLFGSAAQENSHLFYFPRFACYSTDRSFLRLGDRFA